MNSDHQRPQTDDVYTYWEEPITKDSLQKYHEAYKQIDIDRWKGI